MKILYGVQSDGMGHALRSKPVIEHLISQGHSIKIITAGRALEFFKKHFPDVEEVEGLSFYYHNNKVSYIMTGVKSILNSLKIINKSILPVKKIVKKYKPDVIITDFELFSAKAGLITKTPVISIDNISILFLAKLPFSIKTLKDYMVARITGNIFNHSAHHYFVTSFFKAELLNEKKNKSRVSFVPPILRKEIMNIQPSIKDHIIVYQTTNTNRKLIPALHGCPRENFIYYGCNEDKKDKNITFKKFAEKQFIRDFASSKAVITNGGFTFISEAIFLHKPIFCNPVENHYEQYLNSKMVQKVGYGKYTKSISEKEIKIFIENLGTYRRKISKYNQQGNNTLFVKLDSILKDLKKSPSNK